MSALLAGAFLAAFLWCLIALVVLALCVCGARDDELIERARRLELEREVGRQVGDALSDGAGATVIAFPKRGGEAA